MTRIATAFCALLLGIASSAVVAAPIEGKTPKGIAYRFEFRPTGDQVAVAFAFRDPWKSQSDIGIRLALYGPSGLYLGANGDDHETILRKLREAGAETNPSVPFQGLSGGTVTFPRDKLEDMVALLSAIIQTPDFPDKQLQERHKKVLIGVREKFNRDALNQLQAVAVTLLLPDYHARQSYLLLGEQHINPPQRQQLVDWHKRVFGRNNLTVAVSGNIREGDAAWLIDRIFGGLPMVEAPLSIVEPITSKLGKVIKIEREVSQVFVRTYATLPRFNEDPHKSIALAVAVRAFGSGSNSVLFKSIRGELGAAYGTSAGTVNLSPQTSLFVVTLQLDPEKAPQAIERLKLDYEAFLTQGIQEESVKDITNELYKLEIGRSTVSRALNQLQSQLRGLPAERVDKEIRLYREIRAGQINETIRSEMPKSLLTVIMAPKRVAVAADCTIKSAEEVANCGFER